MDRKSKKFPSDFLLSRLLNWWSNVGHRLWGFLAEGLWYVGIEGFVFESFCVCQELRAGGWFTKGPCSRTVRQVAVHDPLHLRRRLGLGFQVMALGDP